MTAPLYSNCEKPAKCEGNLGLWFERFFDQYDPRNWEVLKPTTNNNQMGNTYWLLKNFANKKVGDDKQLAAHTQAQMQLAASLQGQSHVFKASWHFVTGMGNPHPVENGFAWHPTLGVPYLTGAAVKGLMRSYIENNLDTDNPENPDMKKLLLDWFGSTDKNPASEGYQSQAGNLIFFDALPTKPVTLGVDIMTPHMGKWYEKGGTDQAAGTAEAVPADWHDPVPVSFLVAKDITLLFSFALRPYPDADKKRPEIALTDVADVLNRALEQAGAGGKTATGYGGMQDDPKALADLKAIIDRQAKESEAQARQAEEKAIREAALSQMNPIERAITECPSVTDAIKVLESGQWSGDDQRQAAQFLKTRMQQEKIWKESATTKNPDKDKDFKRTQTVTKFLS
ncbi:MAG TPA: type III-B CRISPR module RAMP protein Cmr6 [Candidatus Thiothrix moscowensis]|uniref:type III-B CRISPR module RAMP protein Cmr6 n=1 Tax=unclassified Thiothrix TaxID=2636184 RepID=UPI0025D46299|nr:MULTISPECIES: type III-B CRISPR module RAMP protein Cmr6 [unclassified Thiothrix]HRJ53615.1 type III-B CRISPR module RAMP protein Cmr6 [Candidatus Thiothrix moscowensis]HRJ93696.1 type III-B CRISPR module RAMP protein Cmr6 [Candidatus Thiothrix moscowensis]